jgi:hypothetical protein
MHKAYQSFGAVIKFLVQHAKHWIEVTGFDFFRANSNPPASSS